MARGIIGETPEIWGQGASTASGTVERGYDLFADTGTYDETFEEWGYVGPETAAAILKNYVPQQSRILDAACGSGLTGTALRNLGDAHVDGIDISARLLEIAEATGSYELLTRVDMQSFPLPFDELERDCLWKRIVGTDPMPYLPHHPEYGTRTKVQYFVYEVV
jgi:predicted TPR repeat methyltransferase